MRGQLAAVALVAAFALAAAGPPAVAAPPAPAAAGQAPWAAAEFDPDRVVLRVAVRPDGSAAWTVQLRVRLDDENATAGFAAYRSRVSANRSAVVEEFADDVRAMAAAAAEETGREMVVENVSVNATERPIPQEYGVVTYRFEWYGFAAVGDEMRVGDALAGFFLDAETTLVVSWPAGASVDSVRPGPDDRRERAVVWRGPTTFADDEPRVVLTADSTTFARPAGVPSLGGIPDAFVAGTLGGLLVVVAAGLFRRRRGTGERPAAPADSAAPAGPDAAAGDGPGGADPPDPDLLSNEERVLRLLDERGGRMKQQDVVETLDWTETKTSDVVTGMREAGDLEVYRLGRENVVALPGAVEFGPDRAAPDEGDGGGADGDADGGGGAGGDARADGGADDDAGAADADGTDGGGG